LVFQAVPEIATVEFNIFLYHYEDNNLTYKVVAGQTPEFCFPFELWV